MKIRVLADVVFWAGIAGAVIVDFYILLEMLK